ncbi:MAG: ChaN family lipoprotein [Acidobacteriota bacterium]
MKTRLFIILSIFTLWPAFAVAQQPSSSLPSYYIPYHVYDTRQRQWIDLETMLAAVAQEEVVFLGEQHNDPYAHRLQLAIIQGTARRRSNIVLAMEMFERDVQPALNDYIAGRINETEFLSRSRPWNNYLTDYRPLVEYARSRGWPVIGGNAPQRLARAVSNHGMNIVEQFSAFDRGLVAEKMECPRDDYWDRFSKVMISISASHGGGNANPHGTATSVEASPAVSDRIEKLYQAQCLKDETMAESIAMALKEREASKPLVIHVNGDFHSAFGEGTVSRTRRRLPNARIKNVSFIPIKSLDQISVEEYLKQGDYLIFTLQEQER